MEPVIERGTVLSPARLNRAVLARQFLLERAEPGIPTALQRVGGLQTQYAPSGYVGLWSRLRDFRRESLTAALQANDVIQGTLMRVTIHMVAADDYWPIAAAIRTSRREWWERIARQRRLGPIDHRGIATVLRAELRHGPRTAGQLIAAMEHAGYAKPMWEGAGLWVDMVRVPPSGTWERRRADLYGLAEQYVAPQRWTESSALQLLLTRYLTAFGPATPADAAMWMGVPRARLEPAAAGLDLVSYRDIAGATLLDVPGAPLPPADVPAPVRLLPTWDALLLAHCRRAEVLPEALRPLIFTSKNPSSVGTVLVDGAVAATWSWRKDHVEVAELRAFTATQRRQVRTEVEALTAFYRG